MAADSNIFQNTFPGHLFSKLMSEAIKKKDKVQSFCVTLHFVKPAMSQLFNPYIIFLFLKLFDSSSGLKWS